jgi:hypothetical protein
MQKETVVIGKEESSQLAGPKVEAILFRAIVPGLADLLIGVPSRPYSTVWVARHSWTQAIWVLA